MESGPLAKAGHDLSLTELPHGGQHSFVVHAGSNAGAELLAEIPHDRASGSVGLHCRPLFDLRKLHHGLPHLSLLGG